MTTGLTLPNDIAVARPSARTLERAAVVAVVVLAAVLRLIALGHTPLDPFYDAAVRSMGTSWHAFLVGAYEPSARLAIDKPPVDLWLQVASTKLFGFNTVALLLPAALGGVIAVVALYDLLRTLFGSRVALAGALALAVLPIEVITARSDTMDSVMAALLVTAFAVAARGLREGRVRNAVIAGALVGAAFEVKLFEALIAALPLALLWWLGARANRSRRLAGGLGAIGACVAVGLAWLVFVSVAVPSQERPWAFGSSNGSAWNAAFSYDGLARVSGSQPPDVARTPRELAAGQKRLPAPPGPLRLFSAQDGIGSRLGLALAAAWLALALAAATSAWRRLDRAGRAGLAALALWLAIGTVLFSAQGSLRPRYLEAFAPAVAACLAAGVMLVPRARIVLAAALVASAAVSVEAIAAHAQDSGTVGAQAPARVASLSDYLRGHQGSARYEVASLAASPAASLIARDARPVLVLTAAGHGVVSPSALARLVNAGKVRYALSGAGCRTQACTGLSAWIARHGTDVGTAAGLPRGELYALGRS
jgi:4-amino-4-deoxy-L-arabinose transferase-like glycosyltransferase